MVPLYSLVGLVVLVVSEIGMLLRVEPFWTWHTPIAWTGYILLVDGIIRVRRGSSWLTTNRHEFWFLATMSVPLWLVFEGYNLLIHNWRYVNLPENLIVRNVGYAWAFATISPGIFETAELVGVLRSRGQTALSSSFSARASSPAPWTLWALFVVGALMLIWPLVWPSEYLAPPVWLGFICFLDPVNYWLGAESLIGDLSARSPRPVRVARIVNLGLSGFLCGVLWEFWNYWSQAKWIYSVPFFPNVKIFEMPVLGYFGFPPFALECFTMYVTVREFFWRRASRPIGL